jgi:hypothetical protein
VVDQAALLQDLSSLPALLLTAEFDTSLHRVAELAVRHVRGCQQIGVSVFPGDRLETGVWLGG